MYEQNEKLSRRAAAAWDADEIGAYDHEYVAGLVGDGWEVERVRAAGVRGWSYVDLVHAHDERGLTVTVRHS